MKGKTEPQAKPEAGHSSEEHDTRYEHSDMAIRPIAALGIGLILTAVVLYLALWGLFRLFTIEREQADVPPPPVFRGQPLPPQPRLQASPSADLAKMRAEEDARLNSYGWVDPQAGTVRIPIDRAMERILQQGLPARGETSLPPVSRPGNPDSSGGRQLGDREQGTGNREMRTPDPQ
ncbi:MAG: hypothetical protein HYY20_07780 [Candidatus Tectomicrobia bacterium]|uniref:Uncharacterized protein n=1 Tax=Tectimicrobiota bacterium TaxID=2528274 RepID=A0A932FVI5_UNCTE|nr:hypothetical protein [Candidatus Tectomicrobia bacterium]